MPDGNSPSTDPGTTSDPRLQYPIHQERELKVICIGAGASGLLFAYKLQRSFEKFKLTVYDKNDGVGGTWLENKYPGCACDIPAHVYTWSFEPKTDWSAEYAPAAEILDYFETFSRKYDLQQYCKFGRKVSSAKWNEGKALWEIEVTDVHTGRVEQDDCHILINATGVLNAWKLPNIPGLDDYKGKILHTAKWDSTVDLTGKSVGLIGNGSSAIQVLPAIHDKVKSVVNFIRGPTWISPPMGMEQHEYNTADIALFEQHPDQHLQHRKASEQKISALFHLFIAESDVQKQVRSAMVDTMKTKLNRKDLSDRLIPDWSVGCRRITPGPNYLETLSSNKVEVVYGEIQRVTENGCISEDGREYPVDILICATGFDTSYKPRFPLIGRKGQSLADEWAEEANNYLGLGVADFPNYFTFLGPNSPIGNGPVLVAVEFAADYMMKMITRWQTENIHSFSPKKEAVADFMAHKEQFMKSTVWASECRSWYKNNSITGKVTALWPGSTLHYIEAIAEPRYDDWEIRYSGNRFAYFGNGFSQTESDPIADWAYYLKNEDDSPYIGRGKLRKAVTRLAPSPVE